MPCSSEPASAHSCAGSWARASTPSSRPFPLGTLAANLLGGLLVGVASSFFLHNSSLAPEWRLLVITGFMGGLTTFSTFSVEVVSLLARQQFLWALGAASVHLFGSLAMTALGILATNALFVKA